MRCFSSFLHGPWVLVNQSRSPRKGRVCGIFKMAARFFFFSGCVSPMDVSAFDGSMHFFFFRFCYYLYVSVIYGSHFNPMRQCCICEDFFIAFTFFFFLAAD